ncbi:ferrous iron transport protein B [Orenia metallireducens]|uniref:nucleoside recognition domain-containing protein n=1 Tax=Orenia metallireducens TaxID=1413210 RepID=UPI000D070C1D|nr:nucleoside recognition domain-containing protein [Orenia metallireducens]PRX35522.1 ferrous iron transport protein B [Orenia metallireducens]
MELTKIKDFNELLSNISDSLNGKQREQLRDQIVKDIYSNAEVIADNNVSMQGEQTGIGEKIDDILTSKWLGFPIMLLMLGGVFWLTIVGANYPSAMLGEFLFWVEGHLSNLFMAVGAPNWLHGILVEGMYRTLAWVISVMLPPMAIFFPIFTLLEDLGYLPRVAFNLDNLFKKSGANGKQSLTMSMGFGCNAAGVIAARIIESPREKLLAILTNNFVPCNGRFPTLLILSMIFMGTVGGRGSSLLAAGIVVLLVLIGIAITLLVSWILSKTILKGIPSSFTLELPPYRKPQIGRVLVRSFIDRTLFVLWRAIVVAAPAGGIVWLLANNTIGGVSIIDYVANLIDPFATLIGLDGVILMAFILGLPANEIVLPILVMSYLSLGSMIEPDSADALRGILVNNGWTWVTALCTMLFSLLHFPCGTTILTIKKETNSWKWAIFGAVMPLTVAIIVTFLVNQIFTTLFL